MKKAVWILIILSTFVTACGKQVDVRDTADGKLGKIYLDLGIAYLQEDKYIESMDSLKKSVDYNPEDANVYSALALLNDRLDQSDEAESNYEKAIDLDEVNSQIRNNYGAFLCARGRYKEAYAQYQVALENPLYNTPEYAYTNAGLCAARSKDLKKAETEFRSALQKNPRFPIALFQMAQLSYQKGKMMQARAYLQRYSEVSRPNPSSLWLSIRVEKELGDLDAVSSQSLLLKANYPDSEETRLLLDME